MPKRPKKVKQAKAAARSAKKKPAERESYQELYDRACALAEKGDNEPARSLYGQVQKGATQVRLKALVRNDLAAMAACGGDMDAARKGVQEALGLDPDCEPAQANLGLLDAEEESGNGAGQAVGRIANPSYESRQAVGRIGNPSG